MELQRKLQRLLFIALLLLIFFCIPATTQAGGNSYGSFSYEKAYEVLNYTNQIRARAGRAPLQMDSELLSAAMLRATEIQVIFSHTRPNGTPCFTASDRMFAENIAFGQKSAAAVVEAWNNSWGHYLNLINADYKSIGIGCYSYGGTLYWVQCFGISPAAPGPSVTGTAISAGEQTTTKSASTTTTTNTNIRTVKLNANGGSLSASSNVKTKTVSVVNQKKYGTLPKPVRKGYLFKGWYTKKSGGTKITASRTVSIAKGKTLTLYAHWTKVSVARTSISKTARKSKGRIVLSWKRVSGAKGYQILCSTKKNFRSGTRILSASGTRKAATVTGLKRRKRYYFKVRAWKTDSCGKKVYGKYSKVKSVVYR